jgi:hypothetical protein
MDKAEYEEENELETCTNNPPFSNAAATRSLSANCLFTASSLACVPGVILISILNRFGNDRNNFTRMDKPINVAIEHYTQPQS